MNLKIDSIGDTSKKSHVQAQLIKSMTDSLESRMKDIGRKINILADICGAKF